MRGHFLVCTICLLAAACARPPDGAEPNQIASQLPGFEHMDGFIDMYWDEQGGRLILQIEQFDEPMIYQTALARGVGSNDIGLDRGQLGRTRVVEFQRSGPNVLLVEKNLKFRAVTDNPDEQRAVAESFAQSVIWGFESLGEADGKIYIDATSFVARDVQGVAVRFAELEEGTYEVDSSRSAIFMPRTRAFPDNSEAEAVVTLVGSPAGEILSSVVPDPTSITVHVHHSFVRLPDGNYTPIPYDPRSGILGLQLVGNGFADYASTIGERLEVNYGRRHRLQKKDPTAEFSEPVVPIVYYIDRGAPEPVRSALLDGARWWGQAFAAAGYRDAFRVEMLPENADPLDVRYNVIQWVHRSTRGWSYGYPVMDPRTGEIIKGHVSLGSLRVRQDYLIAEGLLSPYSDRSVPDDMLEMSLARIRQLSAHEVGHTLGIGHNFAASTQDRASVMDYPFPLIKLDGNGALDLSAAYDDKIGAWDKRVILYAYQDFPDGVDENLERRRILEETVASFKYVANEDANAPGTAHPDGNLWDNGADPVAELRHLMRVRAVALQNFSERNIRLGRPLATLEEALVPVYLLHRYQITAASKLIGGLEFTYAMRGDGQRPTSPVSPEQQRDAIAALLETIDPQVLRLPEGLLSSIPPRPPGYVKSRESFPGQTGLTFDPMGPPSSAATLTMTALLDAHRAARLVAQNASDSAMPGFADVCGLLFRETWQADRQAGMNGLIQRSNNLIYLKSLMALSASAEAGFEVKAIATDSINRVDDWLSARTQRETDDPWRALYAESRRLIRRFRDDPTIPELFAPVVVPPGSPIGAESVY